MESRGYDYGSGASAGGKIRRRPPSPAVDALPYARPATAPTHASVTATAVGSQGGRWLYRIIAAGASRLLPSMLRTSPPQLTAPAQLPLEEPPSSYQLPVDAPPSPLPPPLEDDLPEGEENGGWAANNLCNENSQSSGKKKEETMLRNSDDRGGLDLEELLKQRIFTRSEFEYLADLLWARTNGTNSLVPEDGNTRKVCFYEKENGSRHSNLPVDFSTTRYSVADEVASPAEIAKAYMGSKSSKGSPLRLRLHNPSSMPIKSMEASMIQKVKPPTIPVPQGSRFHTSKTSDCLESNYATPNRSAVYKMSSPYFKSGVSSKELFGSVSSNYQTSSSVHTFGRQVLKRKSTAVSNETESLGPIRKMHQRYNRTSSLLETQLGYRRDPVGDVSKHLPEQLAQTQKRRRLDKVGDASPGSHGIEDRTHVNCFGQALEQSAEMAAKILKQLDTLVPLQNGNTPEIKQKLEKNAIDFDDVSRHKEVRAESDLMEPSPSEVEYFLPDGIKSKKSISQIASNKEKPPLFSLKSNALNLVLSGEIGQNEMSTRANGFSFPVPTGTNAHSQGPPTPTLSSPPILTVEKQPSTFSSALITSAESGNRISKPVLGGPITQKLDTKLNADDQQMPSNNSGKGETLTSNPVLKVVNSKPTSLSNGLGHALNSAIQPSNASTGSASFQCAASSTISTNFASKYTQSCSPAAQDSSEAANRNTTFSSSLLVGIAGSFTTQDKSKVVDSGAPFGFSQQLGTASSTSEDMSRAASLETSFFTGNQTAQSGTSNSLFTLRSSNNFCSNSSEDSNIGSSHCFVDSPVGSTTIGTNPMNSSSVFSWAADFDLATGAAPPSSHATSSSLAFSSSQTFLAQPAFGSKLTTPAPPPSFGLPNTGPATSPFSPMPSAVFSFTSAIPSVPNPSPTTPIFGNPNLQLKGGNMFVDRNESPYPATSPFGFTSSSPSTPIFSTPATQFASSTSASHGVLEVGQYNQASGVFSMGPSGGNEKSGRRIIRVKRRK